MNATGSEVGVGSGPASPRGVVTMILPKVELAQGDRTDPNGESVIAVWGMMIIQEGD